MWCSLFVVKDQHSNVVLIISCIAVLNTEIQLCHLKDICPCCLLLWLPWAPQLSQDVTAAAGFLSDKASVFGDTKKRTRHIKIVVLWNVSQCGSHKLPDWTVSFQKIAVFKHQANDYSLSTPGLL